MKRLRVNVFCDGACKGNPGPGGWGVYMVTDTVINDTYPKGKTFRQSLRGGEGADH